MKSKEAAKRLSVMLLALVMMLSMTGYPFVEAFAEDGDEPVTAEESLGEESAAETGSVEAAVPEEPAAEATEVEDPEEARQDEAEPAEEAEPEEEVPEEEMPVILEEVPEEILQEPAADAVELEEIRVRASIDESFVTVFWTKVEGASYYKVFLNDETSERKKLNSTENKCIIYLGNTDLAVEKVRVEAYRPKEAAVNDDADNNGEETAPEEQVTPVQEDEKFAEGITDDVHLIKRGKLSSRNTIATYLGLSLRTMLGEGNNGYAVTQGAATDGKYAYYMLASSSNQKGRVLKVNLSNSADYVKGPVINIHHANGMTYDSKRNQLVAVGYGAWRQQLSFIDPNSLTLVSQQYLSYPYNIDGVNADGKQNGIAAIAYIKKYNVYVARSRGRNNGVGDSYLNNDIWVINADNLRVIGHVYVHITGKYPETYQAMDADEKYVYYLLSPGSGQKKNIILCLDWDSENLLPVLNGEKEYVEYTWKANNNDSGDPDAVLTIPIAHESEGLFHTTDANGNSCFYVSEYYGRWHYKTVTKKVKVKWKKVRKWYNKKTKKWTTKKPKKKYRGKSKKVWKYKKKKKKVTVKDYWARDNYVYCIGSF